MAVCALLAGALGLTGCAHLGQRVQRGTLPPGAPKVETILADLAANDAAMQNFRAVGTISVKAQDKPVQVCTGAIQFRKPGELSVIGRDPVLGRKVFDVRCAGDRYMIMYKDEVWRGEGKTQIQGVSWKVSPSEIAREMFLPETWSGLAQEQVHMADYDEARHTATLLIGRKAHPRRRIEVTGPPWDVTRNALLDPATGAVAAETVLSDYHSEAGVRFPAQIDARFPIQDSRLTFKMKTITPNTQLDPERFEINDASTNENTSH